MQQTKIEYLTHTWNPIAMRCTPVSEGCANCWHLRMAKRLQSVFENYSDSNHNYGWRDIDCEKAEAYAGGDPYINTKELSAPFKLRKPAVIGVQFMGDLFHDSIPFEWIAAVCGVIAANPRHQFVVLTKRLDRAAEFYNWLDELATDPKWHVSEPGMRWWKVHMLTIKANDFLSDYDWPSMAGCTWPLTNLILGTSVENQRTADERILKLLQIPAWKRMVSYEPALGPVDLGGYYLNQKTGLKHYPFPYLDEKYRTKNINLLDIVVAGAETGPGARPCDLDWLRSARNQCAAAGVQFFLKQVDSKGTRELDGQRHDEWIWKGECK